MLNEYIEKQPVVCDILNNEILNGQLSHAYLFDENNNSESLGIVMAFIKDVLSNNLNDDEKKVLFKRIDDGNYSELKIIEPDGMIIKKKQILELQQIYSTKALEGIKRIYVIKDADKMRGETANSMLKFLEEPDNDIIAILMTNNLNNMLSTIVSRCQIIRLSNSNNLLYDDDINSICLDFIEYLSDKKIYTFLSINDILLDKLNIKDRQKLTLFFDKLIDLYYDILKLKINNSNIVNTNEMAILKKISDCYSYSNLLDILNYLLNTKESIKYNVNCLALIDSVIYKIGGCYENCRS